VRLLIDNYDSFTWNLVQRFSEIDPSLRIEVVRNDAIDVAGAEALAPTHLVISPGPCTPKEAGISGALLSHFRGRIPALGVCLGHQAIGDIHGMTVRRNDIAVHGKTSLVEHDGRGLSIAPASSMRAQRALFDRGRSAGGRQFMVIVSFERACVAQRFSSQPALAMNTLTGVCSASQNGRHRWVGGE